jgi:hypothetical protein
MWLSLSLAEKFQWSKTWKDGDKFCSSAGSDWDFQIPSNWTPAFIAGNELKKHFAHWQKGDKDREHHFLWFISGGQGSGKSRCLDEFPSILRTAVSQIPNSEDLSKRLDDMCVFKVKFGNGQLCRGTIPHEGQVPARMAFQLQESSMCWTDFSISEIAKSITFEDVIDHLLEIRGASTMTDLTILILVDSLQGAQDALQKTVSLICNLTNSAIPFVMVACAANIQTPIRDCLKTSRQPFIYLTPAPILEPQQIKDMYNTMPRENRLMAKILIRDMGGHGRALENLAMSFSAEFQTVTKPSVLVSSVKERLKYAYQACFQIMNPAQISALLTALICGHKYHLHQQISGTGHTVDEIFARGLFWFDETKMKLSVAYFWMLLTCDFVDIPELQALIRVDYDKMMEGFQQGKHASLSFSAFEEFWCNFRAVRSRCYEDGARVKWRSFHSGARFIGNCDFDFVNRHLSFSTAKTDCHGRFGTKSNSQDVTVLSDGANLASSSLREESLDRVLINASGAFSADSAVFFKSADGVVCTEAHHYKGWDATKMGVTESDVPIKCGKATDLTDCVVLICRGKLELQGSDRLESSIAVIDADCFEEYFGPFAGPASSHLLNTGPADFNLHA